MRIKSNNINKKKIFELSLFKKQVYIIISAVLITTIFFGLKFLYENRNLSRKEQRSLIINQFLTLYNLPKAAYVWMSNKTLDHNQELNSIKIDIKPSNYQKLINLKNDALKGPFLKPKHKLKIPAILSYNGINYNITVRLKGESAPYHAKGPKWSIRVDTKDLPIAGKFYSFSLQHPKRRSYIMSMLMRVLMSSESHIYNEMILVNLKINNINMGIYNLEEVYTNKSISKKTGYPSVIFSFDETHNINETTEISDKDHLHDGYYKSIIKPAQPKEVYKNKDLYDQFEKGAALLEKFRFKKLTTSQVFDLDKLAAWLAIGDVFGGWHGFSWGNAKFTYNPETDKIYPLIWDMIDENNFATSEADNPLNVRLFRLNDPYLDPNSVFWKELFSDPNLISMYIGKLNQLCKEDHLKSVLSSKMKLIKKYMFHLHKDYPQISYEKEIKKVYNNIQFLKKNYLDPAVPAFASLVKNKEPQLIILNRKPIPIEIIGIRNKKTNKLIPLSNRKIIVPRAPFKMEMKKYLINLNISTENNINFNNTSNYVVEVRILGIDKIHQIDIEWYAYNYGVN